MNVSRKNFLKTAGIGLAATGVGAVCAAEKPAAKFRFALNPASVRGYKLSLKDQVRFAVQAGYDGIEPWLADVQAAKKSGELADIRKMCADGGLAVVNGIGFAHWALSDATARTAGLEEMKRDMGLIAEMGGAFIAAPPFGLQSPGSSKVSLDAFAERYRAVLAIGDTVGVVPVLEFWGHSVNLSRLDEALFIAAAAGHPKACILADVYHLYRGGSSFDGLRLLSPSALPVLHMNDYPAKPAREKLTDPMRVWPGDGIAPWQRIFDILRAGRLNPWLSVEVFNKSYWTTTPLETMKAGLSKMRRVAHLG